MFKLYFICFAALIFRTWRGIRKCLSKNKHKTKTHSIFKLFCHPMPYVIEKLQLHHANNKILCSEMRRPGHIYGTAKVHAEANSIILSRSAEWSAVYVLCWCMMYGHRCMFYVDVWCMVSGVCFISDLDELISVGIMWAIKLFNQKLSLSTEKLFIFISRYEMFTVVELNNLLASKFVFMRSV